MDDAPEYVALRTGTVVDEDEPPRDGDRQAPLTDYADTSAYVLIAEPGAGKTTAFKTEAAKQGAVHVTVRNFLRFDKPEWRDTTLFLDGLDESRARPGDRRTPLDGIVKKLDGLGCQPFRLSCRWSFWLAANDKNGVGCGKGRNDTLRTIQRFCHLYSPVSRMWAQPRGEMCGRNSGTTGRPACLRLATASPSRAVFQ